MRYFITTIILALTIPCSGYAQDNKSNSVAQEDMYVHLNSSLLFSGEYLYYKLYCLDASTHKTTNRSDIAYVTLIDSNKKSVFDHKIILEDGLGHGDFFVPSTIPSGTYKIIAYTQWMQNNLDKKFFEASIKIVNPYIAEINNTQEIAVINTSSRPVDNSLNNVPSKNLNIKIDLDTQKLSTRSPLSITVQNNMGIQGNGNYSISVRKVPEIEAPSRLKATSAISQNLNTNRIHPREATFKPETGGYLLKGTVINKKTQQPGKAIDVAISIPGEDFYFTVATTNTLGSFSFEIDPDFPGTEVILQVVESNKEDYAIEILPNKTPNYSQLEFPKFSLNEVKKEKIIARSVYNQIENGYYDLKPDTIVEKVPATSFVRYEKGVTYNLDDYTRFKTMKEVFTEIVSLAWTTIENGTRVVKVLQREMSEPTPYLPLLYIDGVFVENHTEFLNVDALEIQTIKVVRKGFYFGKKEYQGVVLMTTKKGDFMLDQNLDAVLKKPLFLPQQSKRYFSQLYSEGNTAATQRIPDYRLQLLWDPTWVIASSETKTKIYTSDVSGTYEVVMEGFTNQGVPISLTEQFEVYDSNNN